jgi:OOP family OmpA-OmpF porin
MADPSCEPGKAPVLVMSKAVASAPEAPMPAAVIPTVTGYATDANGKIARNANGLCWRTANWTPAVAVAECEGGAAPVATAPAAAPAATTPVAAAPKAAAAAPAPMTVSSDGLFDFGKSTLRKGGDALLAPIAAKLKSAGKVAITGHTDRLGNDKANMVVACLQPDRRVVITGC